MSVVLSMVKSLRSVERAAVVIQANEANNQAYHEYVSDLHRRYLQGDELNLENDPWLTPKDIAYIRSQICIVCTKQYCQCDDEYQQMVENELSQSDDGDGRSD